MNKNIINFLACIALISVVEAKAQEEHIEEIVVVAQQVQTTDVNPENTSRLISAVIPAFTYNPGGYGGFIGFNQTGAQAVHTSVFVNDVPANEPGSGLYDFGHDIATGQTVKVITGPNGVLYGSGSIAGTVLIQDTIQSGLIFRHGSNHSHLSIAPTDNFQLTKFESHHPSVRNDNFEKDKYSNVTGKFNVDLELFSISGKYIDYDYDYDNCFDSSFNMSNDCSQVGDRYVVTVQNDNFIVGRSENNATYFTAYDETFSNSSSRDYFRLTDSLKLSSLSSIEYGVDYSMEDYNQHSQENFAGFVSANLSVVGNDYNIGIRRGNSNQNSYRVGIERGLFYASVGTSFRRPNLYELHGDNFVNANLDLQSEKGKGFEAGFGTFGIFKYLFDETIDYNYVDNVYYNAGKYTSQGAKYNQTFGPVSVMIRYTDTGQPRVPKYMGMLSVNKDVYDTLVSLKYTFNLDRQPGLYDGSKLEDLHKVNFYITKKIDDLTLNFKIENLLDEKIEVVPFYSNIGRQFYLTLSYDW